ncbi:MAG: pyridoxal-phosphate dependent enzyme [Anaerolineales bacterium]|nr:pyridoxal-phosphate dependent enzyme [Anaerolineales bacterium]
MTGYACLDCGQAYQGGEHHRCPACGGIFSVAGGIQFNSGEIDHTLPGIWPYRHTFGLPENAPNLSLGEGNTPRVPVEVDGNQLWLKLESLSPTGSYKDRMAAVLVSALAAEGVSQAVEDSSGNAGAAFAAYCARADIRGKVFVPQSAAGPKGEQIARFGAEVVPVPGPRQAATDAVLSEVVGGAVYASHAYLPQGLSGAATIAYELADKVGNVPGMVIAPVGHGGLLLGIIFGFQALLAAGEITRLPKFIGVQAQENAPIWAAAKGQEFAASSTCADGIAVSEPVRGSELLELYRQEVVDLITVAEEAIWEGREVLLKQGIDAELTSAVVIDAYRQLIEGNQVSDKGQIVAIISGHGLKQ